MSFFDPSKTTQPAGAQSTTPGFGLGTNFSSMQNQAKPGTFTLGTTPASTFGSLGTPATSATTGLFGTTSTNQPPNLTFSATPAASTGDISFGLNPPATSFGASKIPSSTTATPNAAASNLSFGTPKTSTTGGFTAAPSSTPAQPFGSLTTSTPASSGFILGSTATSNAATSAAATTTTGGINFGMTNTSIASLNKQPAGLTVNTATSAAPTSSSSSSGFSLLSNTTTAPSTGFSLSTPSNSTSLSFSLTGNTTSTPASTGFTLDGNKTTTTTTTTATTTTTTTGTQNTAALPPTTLGNVTTVTPSSNIGQSGSINFCQLEESINKWTLELEEQERAFVNQATQINAWDKLLISNGEKIVTLNEEVERVKVEQQKLEHELDYVVGQQKELQDCLLPLEKETSSLSVSDSERVSTYRLAENLDTQLKQMSEDLKEIIEHLNEANRGQDSSDPMVQIGKILNAHMNSLQWLDQKTSIIGQKIQQIDQLHQNYRQENERSFSLAYN